MKPIIRWLLRIIMLIMISLILLLMVPWEPLGSALATSNYSNWMAQTISLDTPVTSIAMLGAHDAMAHPMTLTSSCDRGAAKNDDTASQLACASYGFLYRGLLIRYAHTQRYDITTLLNQGIRYFDVRLSYDEVSQTWYHNHTYLSLPFAESISAIKDFLSIHPGEVLLLDFQHIYDVRTTSGRGDENSYEEIKLLLQESGLYDLLFMFPSNDISTLTYGEVTSQKTRGVALATFPWETNNSHFLNRDHFVRSIWHNRIRIPDLLADIENEHQTLLNLTNTNTYFRIMQAQVTASLSPDDILATLGSISLLHAAQKTHQALLATEKLSAYLTTTPIIMIDYAANNRQQSHEQLMETVIAFNQSL